MPIRAYEPLQKPCRLCGMGFDQFQKASEPPLEACPKCGGEVRLKPIAAINTPQLLKPISVSDAKAAGFTVLKRIRPGEYEKQ